jgi:hypothetical protein
LLRHFAVLESQSPDFVSNRHHFRRCAGIE